MTSGCRFYFVICLYMLPLLCVLACGPAAGEATIDATLVNGDYMRNRLVEWDGGFVDRTPARSEGDVVTCFKVLNNNGPSTPYCSAPEIAWLDEKWATQRAMFVLNTFTFSPSWPNGFPMDNPPRSFWITIEGPDPHDGYMRPYFSLDVKVREWYGVTVPTSCTVRTAPIAIGPISNDAIGSATAPVSVKCNADTAYSMTVGSANNSDLISYTPGGQLRMSFDGGTGPKPNVISGHAKKNTTITTNARATTVPGTALPGKYTASAVVAIEIL